MGKLIYEFDGENGFFGGGTRCIIYGARVAYETLVRGGVLYNGCVLSVRVRAHPTKMNAREEKIQAKDPGKSIGPSRI